jgi:hypothetical protein
MLNSETQFLTFSYQIIASSWSKIFSAQGDASIRKTPFDVVALGLWVEQFHGHDLVSAKQWALCLSFSEFFGR